jgi:hypothetical protein
MGRHERGLVGSFPGLGTQPVVSDPVEGPLYVQEDGKSVLLQIGMSGGVRVLQVGVVGDLVDLFEGFGEAIRFVRGGCL